MRDDARSPQRWWSAALMVSTEFPDSVKVDNDGQKKWQNTATIAVTKITFLLFLCRRGWLQEKRELGTSIRCD
jgi:hypothetical protein